MYIHIFSSSLFLVPPKKKIVFFSSSQCAFVAAESRVKDNFFLFFPARSHHTLIFTRHNNSTHIRAQHTRVMKIHSKKIYKKKSSSRKRRSKKIHCVYTFFPSDTLRMYLNVWITNTCVVSTV